MGYSEPMYERNWKIYYPFSVNLLESAEVETSRWRWECVTACNSAILKPYISHLHANLYRVASLAIWSSDYHIAKQIQYLQRIHLSRIAFKIFLFVFYCRNTFDVWVHKSADIVTIYKFDPLNNTYYYYILIKIYNISNFRTMWHKMYSKSAMTYFMYRLLNKNFTAKRKRVLAYREKIYNSISTSLHKQEICFCERTPFLLPT